MIRRPGRPRNDAVDELAEADDTDLAAAVAQARDLLDEVTVVADQHHVGLALDQRLGRALDGDVDDLAGAAERDRLVADRDQGLHEGGGQLGAGVEEEQPRDVLVEGPLGPLQEPVPARPLLGTRTAAEDLVAEGGVDVLPVDEQVGRAPGHVSRPGRRRGTARAPRRRTTSTAVTSTSARGRPSPSHRIESTPSSGSAPA